MIGGGPPEEDDHRQGQQAQRQGAAAHQGCSRFRLEVKPESISLTDYAALRQEKTEFIQSLTMFIQAMAPLQQQLPGSMPYALEMLKWTMAGFKGGTTIEGVLDKAIAAAQQELSQPKPPPPPTPQEQAQKARAQADIQVSQAKAQTDIQTAQTKAQIDLQKNAALAQQDMMAAQAKWRSESISKYGFDPVTGQQVGPRPAPEQNDVTSWALGDAPWHATGGARKRRSSSASTVTTRVHGE